jgi:L-ascorbate metabolism protein UlaG (beta-lactamase superfamily)
MPLLKWHGHACFEIVDSANRSIVIDPHDGGSIGLKRPEASADAVLITHEHFDHNAYEVVLKKGGEVYSMRSGPFKVLDHPVLGIKVYHDKFKGRRRGEVISYLIEVDGVKLLHLGDIGHIPDEDTLKLMDSPHVLMIPVGGTFTIDAREAKELIELLAPKAAVPMHYWVEGVNLPLAPLVNFLSIIKYAVVKLKERAWRVTKEELEGWSETKVVVFPKP